MFFVEEERTRLVRDAALRAGATMSVDSKVTGVTRNGAGFVLQTPAGEVKAREVVATTNGYTGPELGWFRRRLVPVRSYIIATEELPEDQVRANAAQFTLTDAETGLQRARLTKEVRKGKKG